MGLFDMFKKKGSIEKNSVGEPIDRLTPDGELPFGWMAYKKDVIDQIESELSVFRKGICEAEEPRQCVAAIKSYLQYLDDGKKHYYQIGECEGKYFEEYIINSEETNGNIRKLKLLEAKAKKA